MNSSYKQLRVGLAGLGSEAYWAQFDRLISTVRGISPRWNEKLGPVTGRSSILVI